MIIYLSENERLVFAVCWLHHISSCLLVDIYTPLFYFFRWGYFWIIQPEGRVTGAGLIFFVTAAEKKTYYYIFIIFLPSSLHRLLCLLIADVFTNPSLLCFSPSACFFPLLSGSWAAMTKSYEFNWQKHLPEFMQEGASFDRFDEVKSSLMRSKAWNLCFTVLHIFFLKDTKQAEQAVKLGRCRFQTAHPDIFRWSDLHLLTLTGSVCVTSCVGLSVLLLIPT